MSAGRFLVSSKEVLQSEFIAKIKTLQKQHLNSADFVIASTETDVQVQQFIQDLDVENFENL